MSAATAAFPIAGLRARRGSTSRSADPSSPLGLLHEFDTSLLIVQLLTVDFWTLFWQAVTVGGREGFRGLYD